jgi:hypothetical protein
MLLFGTQALGSVLWGAVAEWMGVVAAFLIAAAALVIGLATIRLWPFYDVSGLDRNAAPFWPEPELAFDVAPNSGPVMVETAYSIAPDREEAFLEAMIQVRLSRLRTGARRWVLYRDGEKPHPFSRPSSLPPGKNTCASTGTASPAPIATSTQRREAFPTRPRKRGT